MTEWVIFLLKRVFITHKLYYKVLSPLKAKLLELEGGRF